MYITVERKYSSKGHIIDEDRTRYYQWFVKQMYIKKSKERLNASTYIIKYIYLRNFDIAI